MVTSKNIAAIIGPVFLALGLSMLVNPQLGPEIVGQMRGNILTLLVAGILTLVAGLAIVRFHRETSGWPLLVTMLGWLLVAAGIVRIVFPHAAIDIGESMAATPSLITSAAVLVLTLGGYLTWKAYH